MDARTLGIILAVGSVSFYYFAWRFWSLRLATPRPGTKFAALSAEQRLERLKHVATMSGLLGTLMLGAGIWMWLKTGG
jgi:hypothetical protein